MAFVTCQQFRDSQSEQDKQIEELQNKLDNVQLTPGPKGDKGDKGEPFRYSDFTPEQLAAIKGPKGDKGERGLPGERGEAGANGATGSRGLQGERGPKGEDGATFKPVVQDGVLSWTNDKGLDNPSPVNIATNGSSAGITKAVAPLIRQGEYINIRFNEGQFLVEHEKLTLAPQSVAIFNGGTLGEIKTANQKAFCIFYKNSGDYVTPLGLPMNIWATDNQLPATSTSDYNIWDENAPSYNDNSKESKIYEYICYIEQSAWDGTLGQRAESLHMTTGGRIQQTLTVTALPLSGLFELDGSRLKAQQTVNQRATKVMTWIRTLSLHAPLEEGERSLSAEESLKRLFNSAAWVRLK